MIRIILAMIAASMLVACGRREPGVDIWTAAATGDTAALREHIGFGTDLDVREPGGGSSPLIVAALFGQTEAARLLAEHGASLDLQNGEGSTALHTAAFFCRPEVVALLLERGASTELKNKYGRTALDAVSGEWSGELEARYTGIAGALNIPLDLERIKKLRPQVADLIRRHDGV